MVLTKVSIARVLYWSVGKGKVRMDGLAYIVHILSPASSQHWPLLTMIMVFPNCNQVSSLGNSS